MSDSSPNSISELRASLEDLETSISTPILSGEFATWVEQLHLSWTQAAPVIQRHIAVLHSQQFAEIVEQDPELLSRVDLLKAENREIEFELGSLDGAISRLGQKAGKLEPDESLVATGTAEELVDKTLQFTSRVRKQSVAVQSWYFEAFQRDRGSVD